MRIEWKSNLHGVARCPADFKLLGQGQPAGRFEACPYPGFESDPERWVQQALARLGLAGKHEHVADVQIRLGSPTT
ncbi:MAG: hypothetical protein WHU10_05815 [Fimbriimonadales bacterium]